MKSRFFLPMALALTILSCGPKEAKDPAPAPTEINDTILPDAAPDSRNSLNYLGTYEGHFPCEDCGNDKVLLELSEDFNYTFSKFGDGKADNKLEKRGTFKWDASGKGILLSDFDQPYDHFLVTEHSLVALDEHNLEIPKYTLKKLTEAKAERADESPSEQKTPVITGIHWKLSELNGKPASVPKGQDFYISLSKNGQLSAFAGCNRMGGKYEITGSKVRLFQIISTMMACPGMEVENQLKIALESADNFVANEQLLQLRKGGVNLVKFESGGPEKAK